MNPIYERLRPEQVLEAEQIARLIYETRENRRQVLAALGAQDEAALLARIVGGELDEHPAWEHYLAACVLTSTHEAARATMAALLQEANR